MEQEKEQTNQFENQNNRQTSASIEKENNSQQKHDQIRNLKYHNRKKQEMSTFQKSVFSNAVARKKRKWSSLLLVY